MRKSGAAALAVLALTFGASAHAEGINNLVAGLNGIVTAPADPVMGAVQPTEAFDDIWAGPATAHFMGFLQGTVMMTYRLAMGVFDIALFPFMVFPTLSPEARYDIIPEYEIEYE